MKFPNIANSITFFRVIIGAVLLYSVFIGKIVIGATLFALFAFLDMLDGYAARKFNCETLFGKNFDILTDAVVGCSLAVMLIVQNTVPTLYLLLLAVPLLIYVVSILRSIKIVGKTIIYPTWKKYNAGFFCSSILLFMINVTATVIVAYLLLPYFYVAAGKYSKEIKRKL